MSGQYPPPNPAHPFNRAPLHQRGPPTPWGHNSQPPSMNVVGTSMNFYGSPHMGLPGRGTQPWTHPKPPAASNPLYNLPMQRVPADYHQEETMDLSSHSSTADIPKIVSARSETSDPLRNGTILSPELNGVTEPDVKESIVTSVIAANPLRESVGDTLNCSKTTESQCLEAGDNVLREVDTSTNSSVVKGDNSINTVNLSEPVNTKTTTSGSEPHITSRLDSSSPTQELGESKKEDTLEIYPLNRTVAGFDNTEHSVDTQSICESETFLDHSSLSVDTDEAKLVVADSSAEDIFGVSPVESSALTVSQEPSQTPSTTAETVSDKTIEASFLSSDLNDKRPGPTIPTLEGAEPHPSVENVEILLESMFNSQEETSCSSQNSNSGVSRSVIVSNGTKVSEVSRLTTDLLTPMKEEELAMTLAEDGPVEAEIKEESVVDNLMDEIEKKLEMLTESSSFEKQTNVSEDGGLVKDEEDSQRQQELIPTKEPEKEEKPVLDQITEPPKALAISNNPFIEVETELEKMFAGIVEPTDDLVSENPLQPSVPKKPAVTKRSITRRKKANSRRPSDISVFGSSSGDTFPVKKKGRKGMHDSGSERGSKKLKVDSGEHFKKGKLLKDITHDSLSGKVKGPFVHIEGSKESPSSVVVVNSGLRADDEDGADKASSRRKHSLLHRPEGASRRAGPAYSSSTLSMRYNSDKADLTWVCVFCKRGPHAMGGEPAGDLFGPYRIPTTPPSDEAVGPGAPADRDVQEEQKKRGGKHPKSLRSSGAADHFIQKMAKKIKRSGSADSWESQAGLLTVEEGYEVWLHESCAQWAPGLCIIGSQVVGLDDAVWTALRTSCTECGETGAGIGCVVRNCPARIHYHCAVLCGWLLDTDTFIARCQAHRTRPRPL